MFDLWLSLTSCIYNPVILILSYGITIPSQPVTILSSPWCLVTAWCSAFLVLKHFIKQRCACRQHSSVLQNNCIVPASVLSSLLHVLQQSILLQWHSYVVHCAMWVSSRCQADAPASDWGCVVCVSSKIGEDQSAEDAEDGPPELLVSDGFMFSITHHSLCPFKCCVALIGNYQSLQQYKLW